MRDILQEGKYFSKKCTDAVTLMSKACRDLSKAEEIVSDLKFYFDTHEIDGAWEAGTQYRLSESIDELEKGVQVIKNYLL